MEFWNLIRNIFGGQNVEKPRDKGFSYYPENYDRDIFDRSAEKNDVIDLDSRYFKGGNQFHIFSDPLEMTRYFESQVDGMLKTFLFGFNSGGNLQNALPSFETLERDYVTRDLRDQMFKSNDDSVLKKLDTDLDGKITVDNFSNIWEDRSTPKMELIQPRIFGRFMGKEYVHRSDGTIEEKQVIKDHEGNEETIISQRVGDQMHTIVTKKDKNGVESKSEDFFNINEHKPNAKWELPSNGGKSLRDDDLNYFPWDKFFKPEPKL